MAQIELIEYSFKYPREDKSALDNINLSIDEGEFVLICGPSGCGKTTLLQQLKKEIIPEGKITGRALYEGVPIKDLDDFIAASNIGMVFQEPESQIVTDRVINELAFSMENLGFPLEKMGRRMGEMVHFFGIEDKLYEKIHNLSGGQKQVLNLASVLLLQPKVLLLDEPTSQLDPVSSKEFIQMVQNLNRDFSITVIITEHRLEELFHIVDRVVMLDEGQIKYDGKPKDVAKEIYDNNDEIFFNYLPSISKLYFKLDKEKDNVPLTIRDAKKWIKNISIDKEMQEKQKIEDKKNIKNTIINIKNISFRYERGKPLVLDKLSLEINQGEFLSILGGNGSGKSTLLKVVAGAYKPQYGKIYVNGKKLHNIDEDKRFRYIGYLDQNPMLYFLHDRVQDEIYDRAEKINAAEKDVQYIIDLFELNNILHRHPYDISGGEKQKVALAIVLLAKPKILLLDEPTKGIDPISKRNIGNLLINLKKSGITLVVATHDIEFAARFSDRCALLFDKDIRAVEEPNTFFSQNYFYTTSINRIIRDKIPNAIIWEDVVNHVYI
ncbi:energy-coupling factor transport system ATP-binding protein [Keratinibaculum paraultunense]|uniref:Energy-coupling factor transport system ATP-binding protein n=1 Tax=Keratinibaculum paraultunense TaxID=1278232 RepID=A0A4R3L2J8_9FIRM|nr:energy-coupling factor transporter ATPase [Keratinibaculum paraultunense]QQY80152.1 ABC transporter ATP-binding protein [Keratinibaculum paraultunense]TCS91527.1 energy-coupling factor transport system ATP-binding protein [Keratinibaculum paraultunense]